MAIIVLLLSEMYAWLCHFHLFSGTHLNTPVQSLQATVLLSFCLTVLVLLLYHYIMQPIHITYHYIITVYHACTYALHNHYIYKYTY